MDTSLPFSRLLSEEQPVAELWGRELQICLGADARDELHVVAVDSKNASGEHRPVPIAALRSSVLPMISLKALELVPPVTFVLQCGAGPVYLSGQRVTLQDDASSEAEEEELLEEDVGDEDDDGKS
ncbi:PREDICTED: nucleoplasmin ATPase-like [Lepidothrix coronata]|uniref:Nucleoplasmin ATPase-like n=1 Tax=Lepidothrix coronata TaxID=321398 RepID=A0A6J0IL01_9PASS|nr:PREDICTED: nucleoplasmin ATPase-like [Lepidothrix coronata]